MPELTGPLTVFEEHLLRRQIESGVDVNNAAAARLLATYDLALRHLEALYQECEARGHDRLELMVSIANKGTV